MTEVKQMKQRFDGYLPVVVDVETSGVVAEKNALLEVAAIVIECDEAGVMRPTSDSFSTHVVPFEGAVIDEKAMEINKIDPYHPFRFALSEQDALASLFEYVDKALKSVECRRALLVGHNAHFDLGFVRAAMRRCKISRSPFHDFTVLDTATIAGVFFGKTILAKALKEAEIEFDRKAAHSALYDTQKTAELFCQALNSLP